MNKKRKELIQKLIDINYELLDLTDEQLEIVFLTDGHGKQQREHTLALIEGLELALSSDKEITSSIRSIAHLLSRKNLSFERALEIDEQQSKSKVKALGVGDFLDMDYSYIEKYCNDSDEDAILRIPIEDWEKIPLKIREKVETSQWFLGRYEEKGNTKEPFKIIINNLSEN
jgi:hypothetical protein